MDLKVIIPVHKYNDEIEKLLEKAISSVKEGIKVVISCPQNIEDKFKDVEVISNKENKTDFQTLVNQAVGGTEWFSILEFDDTYTKIWFDNVEKYISFNPDASIFMPLELLINYKDGNFIGYGNEAPWASAFSNEIGVIDEECIKEYFDFYLTGSVFNTKDWQNIGGLKPSIKVTFWYEFMLRFTNKGKKIIVIPKIGYNHIVNRDDSLFSIYNKEIDENEGSFWFETAKKEYFYKEDRNVTYNPSEYNSNDDDEDE